MFHDPVELFPRRIAPRIEIKDELRVEREVWIDGRGEDIMREGCDEGGKCGEFFCW